MPEEPRTNAAAELVKRAHDGLNSTGELPPEEVASLVDLKALYTDDFTWEDRRRLIGLGNVDGPADFLRRIATISRSSDQFSISEVIAVRGQRTAAAACELNGGDFATEYIVVAHLSADFRLRRQVVFDLDDRADAIAEAERLHAEGGE